MEWLDRMARALEYIEGSMTEKLDMAEAARIAWSSPFHFQRTFHVITGMTVADYTRHRRLTLAAQELSLGEKVLDVALKYGYETPESFAKAFRKVHGVSPSEARIPGTLLKAFPRISFHISIIGEKDMDYKIIHKEAFNVLGVGRRITTADGDNFNQVPQFWDDAMADGSYQKVCTLAGKMGVMGVCTDFAPDMSEFTYMIAVEDRGGPLPEGMVRSGVPAATWAVFESIGPLPAALQDVTRRIFSEWFPATGWQHDCAPELEVYSEGDLHSPDYRCEAWIPVKK